MPVKTTKVAGRRRLRFESLDAVLADAEYLASVPTKQLGNWTLGQIFMHLATVFEKSIDGTDYKWGWFARRLGPVFVPLWKWWVLRRGMPAGIRPPAIFFKEVAPPERVTTGEGLQALRRAIGRLKSETERDWGQCFGVFTRDEWDRFHMRHAELHLSYCVPEADTQPPRRQGEEMRVSGPGGEYDASHGPESGPARRSFGAFGRAALGAAVGAVVGELSGLLFGVGYGPVFALARGTGNEAFYYLLGGVTMGAAAGPALGLVLGALAPGPIFRRGVAAGGALGVLLGAALFAGVSGLIFGTTKGLVFALPFGVILGGSAGGLIGLVARRKRRTIRCSRPRGH